MTDPTSRPSDLAPAADAVDEVIEPGSADALTDRAPLDGPPAVPDDGPPGLPDVVPASPVPAAAPIATFSLEGRRVPALYLVGWVATLIGAALLLVSFMANGSAASPWLFLAGTAVLVLGLVAAAGSQAVERSGRTDLAYRGPSPVLSFIVVFALTIVGVLVLLAPLSALGLDAGSPFATMLSLAVTTIAYAVVVRVLVVGPGSLSWADMRVRRFDGDAVRELLIGAVFALPVLVVTILLGAVLGSFLERPPSALPESGTPMGLVFNLISAAVLAPIGEELFFRGFTTTAWARTSGAWPAIIRGAVFFAIAHVLVLFDADFASGAQRALFSSIALLPVAIALGWLFLARRSLYAAIGLHGAFNAIQIILLYVAGSVLSQ